MKIDIFNLEQKYYLAHCISVDCRMGAGIALDMDRKFSLREKIAKIYTFVNVGDVILIERVFNLVTKRRYYHKPTYETLQLTLDKMEAICHDNGIKYLAMPRIGCGLDGLDWGKVNEAIKKTFNDLNIEILICYL